MKHTLNRIQPEKNTKAKHFIFPLKIGELFFHLKKNSQTSGYYTNYLQISFTLSLFCLLLAPTLAQKPNISYLNPCNISLNEIFSIYPMNNGGKVPTSGSNVISLAGNIKQGFKDANDTTARFNHPSGVAVDTAGNVYVADYGNHSIRKIDVYGQVSTIAGSGSPGFADRTGAEAAFYRPSGLAVDKDGNVYVADKYNHRIRRISPEGAVTTIAGDGNAGYVDGNATTARLNFPSAVATDNNGNILVCDTRNNCIRKITPDGQVSTIAGNGTDGFNNGFTNQATFRSPTGIAADTEGNIFVADYGNHVIRKIDSQGLVSTFAGNGTPQTTFDNSAITGFNFPTGVTVAPSGHLYVTDSYNNRICVVTNTGQINVLAGNNAGCTNGSINNSTFNTPYSIACNALGNIYIADYGNNCIRELKFRGFAIAPRLPVSFNFDATTGCISGEISSELTPSTYTIIACNDAGYSNSASIEIRTIQRPSSCFHGGSGSGYASSPTFAMLVEMPNHATYVNVIGKKYGAGSFAFIVTDIHCTPGFDNGWDAHLLGLTPCCLFTEYGGQYFQFNSTPDIHNTNLGFIPWPNEQEYTLTFENVFIKQIYPALYLADLVDNRIVDIYDEYAEYTFRDTNYGVNKVRSRFKLLTHLDEPGIVIPSGIVNNSAELTVTNIDNTLIFNNKTSSNGQMILYDISGRQILFKSFGTGITKISTAVPAGIYIIKLNCNGNITTKKLILN